MSARKAKEETESFEAKVQFEAGVSVSVTVVHPKGQALYGIKAISALASTERITGLFHALQHDPTVRARLEELHLGFEED